MWSVFGSGHPGDFGGLRLGLGCGDYDVRFACVAIMQRLKESASDSRGDIECVLDSLSLRQLELGLDNLPCGTLTATTVSVALIQNWSWNP